MGKLPGNILLAVGLILVMGACGPEQEASTDGDAEEGAVEESAELELVELPKAPAAGAGETLGYGFTAEESSGAMTSFLELAINDVHSMWAEMMVQGGYSMPVVDYILTYEGETEATGCTASGETGPDDAFYCAEEDLIVFVNELAMEIWRSAAEADGGPEAGAKAGDFAVAAAMAHLYAHSLQGEWGWLPAEADQESPVPAGGTELNAECLTGIWAQSAYGSDMLDTDAVERTMETLAGAGQFDGAENEGEAAPSERAAAFMAGFDSGMVSSCDPYLEGEGATQK